MCTVQRDIEAETTDGSSALARTNRTLKKRGRREWTRQFLVKLESLGSIDAAARAVGVGRRTVYDERARNPEFDRAVVEAAACSVEAVESTLYQRAVSGASDTAIIFFLKCRKPEVYGDKLLAAERKSIRQQAREEVLAELQAELRQLTPAERKILYATIPSK
jgi:hypothetical protein